MAAWFVPSPERYESNQPRGKKTDMFYEAILQMKKTLGQIEHWLGIAETYAKEKSFDANSFLNFRLAPDQFPFVRQVQTATDTAKLAASRLTGKEAPKHPDTEQTLDELRARLRSVVSYLDGFTAKDFEGAA